MHYHLTNTQLLVGGFILALLLIFALAALLEHLRKKPAPFKNYFFCEYDRDFLQNSRSDDEDSMPDHRSRFTPFRLHDLSANELNLGADGATRPNREQN
jgi:hypothetical protein